MPSRRSFLKTLAAAAASLPVVGRLFKTRPAIGPGEIHVVDGYIRFGQTDNHSAWECRIHDIKVADAESVSVACPYSTDEDFMEIDDAFLENMAKRLIEDLEGHHA